MESKENNYQRRFCANESDRVNGDRDNTRSFVKDERQTGRERNLNEHKECETVKEKQELTDREYETNKKIQRK